MAMGGIVTRPCPDAKGSGPKESLKSAERVVEKEHCTIGALPSRTVGSYTDHGIPITNSPEGLLLNADTLFVQDFIKKHPEGRMLPTGEKLVSDIALILSFLISLLVGPGYRSLDTLRIPSASPVRVAEYPPIRSRHDDSQSDRRASKSRLQ